MFGDVYSSVGSVVGYVVRDDAEVQPRLRSFMTAGTFVQKLAEPQTFSDALVILDEFHERSVEMDLILAWLKQHQASLGLRFVVMSATLDQHYLRYTWARSAASRYQGVPRWRPPSLHLNLMNLAFVRFFRCREVINRGEEGAGLVSCLAKVKSKRPSVC